MAALASTPTSCAGDTVTQHTGLTQPPLSLPLSLRGLPVAARALMVGAHPDDEDSALLAELVLRHGVRTAYLSLTRGEGGQNCLGPESGAALGVLRAGELLASRQYDSAEQLFSPCVDFGYAKRAEDAFAHWPRERVVGSIVQAIRALQPDVLISIWTGTPIDGHGHHRACGAATREAFDLAGDAAAFPEQIRAGLSPWQPKRLLVRVRDIAHQAADDLHVNVGRFDPLLGRSCFEVAMQGRSLHRSQNMGALQLKGGQNVVYRVGAGVPAAGGHDADPLDGLPVRLEAWAQAALGDRPDVVTAIAALPFNTRMRPGRSFTRSGPSRRLPRLPRRWADSGKPSRCSTASLRPCTTACGNAGGASKPLGCKPTAWPLRCWRRSPT